MHGWLMQVLFDTLKYHGASFTAPFWARVFDSVLLPIFDHVRAEVGPLLWQLGQSAFRMTAFEVLASAWLRGTIGRDAAWSKMARHFLWLIPPLPHGLPHEPSACSAGDRHNNVHGRGAAS